MIHSKIKTTIKGGKQVKDLRAELKKYKFAFVTIGFHEDAGTYPGANPPSVVEVALWNEFGTSTSPARSFLRSTMDDHESTINKWRDEAIENITFKGWSVKKALEMMGLRIQILIQNKIKSNVQPALKPSTAKSKALRGRPPVTLIDSGLMLRSVAYKVNIG